MSLGHVAAALNATTLETLALSLNPETQILNPDG